MNNSEIKTYRLIIKGKVQNVGFRHWFSDLAISLGLNGYVQNKESKDPELINSLGTFHKVNSSIFLPRRNKVAES